MSEDNAILQVLERGEIVTPVLAYELTGCLALHSAIARLRKRGHDIPCRMRSGNGKRWGEYTLLERIALG